MGKNIIWLCTLAFWLSCSKNVINPVDIEKSVEIGFKQALETRLTKEGISMYKISIDQTKYQPASETVKIEYGVVYRKDDSADIDFKAESILKPKKNLWGEISRWNVVETSEKEYAIGFLSPTEVIARETGK